MRLPFKTKWSKPTAPLLNWNLTYLSKPTLVTFKVFKPKDKDCEGPLKLLPLAVDFATLTFAPPEGKLVTLIVKVWTDWLEAPSETWAAVKTWVQVVLGPFVKTLLEEISPAIVVSFQAQESKYSHGWPEPSTLTSPKVSILVPFLKSSIASSPFWEI